MIPIQNTVLYMPNFQIKENAAVSYNSAPKANALPETNLVSGADLMAMQYKLLVKKPAKDSVLVKTGDMDFQPYKEMGAKAVEDIKARAGQKGQFLNWIGVLPETQLKNIDSIYKDIRDQLIYNYKTILYQDIEKVYKDIRFNLLRVSDDSKRQLEEFIKTTEMTLTEKNRKVEEQKRNVEAIKNAKYQLQNYLVLIDQDTQKRISKIVDILDNRINRYYN